MLTSNKEISTTLLQETLRILQALWCPYSFGDISPFLSDNNDLPTVSCQKLTQILIDQPKCRKLKIELAVTVDSTAPFNILKQK